MTRIAIVSLASALCLTAAAHAADDVMAGYYGNTAIATGGRTDTHTTYYADHTFDMRVPVFGLDFKGTWKLDGATLCRTYETPPPHMPNPFCSQIEAHKVGDTWTMTASGQSRTVTLVKGVQ